VDDVLGGDLEDDGPVDRQDEFFGLDPPVVRVGEVPGPLIAGDADPK
jgi:hypothetical protein